MPSTVEDYLSLPTIAPDSNANKHDSGRDEHDLGKDDEFDEESERGRTNEHE